MSNAENKPFFGKYNIKVGNPVTQNSPRKTFELVIGKWHGDADLMEHSEMLFSEEDYDHLLFALELIRLCKENYRGHEGGLYSWEFPKFSAFLADNSWIPIEKHQDARMFLHDFVGTDKIYENSILCHVEDVSLFYYDESGVKHNCSAEVENGSD